MLDLIANGFALRKKLPTVNPQEIRSVSATDTPCLTRVPAISAESALASNENQCMWCMGIQDVYLDPYYCVYCESCLDCGSDKEACLCWKPDRKWYEEVNVLGTKD